MTVQPLTAQAAANRVVEVEPTSSEGYRLLGDSYAARGGWISDRRITSVTYHNHYGEVATTTVTPEMLT